MMTDYLGRGVSDVRANTIVARRGLLRDGRSRCAQDPCVRRQLRYLRRAPKRCFPCLEQTLVGLDDSGSICPRGHVRSAVRGKLTTAMRRLLSRRSGKQSFEKPCGGGKLTSDNSPVVAVRSRLRPRLLGKCDPPPTEVLRRTRFNFSGAGFGLGNVWSGAP